MHTDEICKLQGAHRVMCPQLHALVNVLSGCHTLSASPSLFLCLMHDDTMVWRRWRPLSKQAACIRPQIYTSAVEGGLPPSSSKMLR